MLFNSYTFLLAFLPASLLIFHGLRRAGLERASFVALILMSLLFYAYWNAVYLLLLVPLTLFNFILASAIVARRVGRPLAARTLLIAGIATNLGVLGYFKYANFFVDNMNSLLGADIAMATIVLPLGISFFTFQKIAFIVDAYRGRVDRLNLLDFSLFVSFFPQLIAGPIVHHAEVLPQFRRRGWIPSHDLVQGATIFAIGLAKKVLIADTAALYAAPGFAAAANGVALDTLSAWSAALAYTTQLYFDFSGYSDMAIGCALLFGIRLPVNFASPYKATSIIDFWRRWHITLSRFLRDYLYMPLGGNRHGSGRRYFNLLLTMLLGGLWHGAGWTYVVWGALHGTYLMINHAWRAVREHISWLPRTVGPVELRLGQALTFLAVVVGWVFFRATDLDAASVMLRGMAGANGLGDSASVAESARALLMVGALLLIAWFGPNTQQLVGYEGPAGSGDARPAVEQARRTWQPTTRWAVLVGCLTAISFMSLSKVSEFLYFQF
jgi:D-alanyl-lipoteichoic acid acyltransferase DltB (MBOAT superfamily)